MSAFGNKMKELRIRNELTLREFCRRTDYDPSNWSKIERGLLNPPDDETLKPIILELKVKMNSAEEQEILDLASLARNQLPADITEDHDFVSMLPAFFRTVRGDKPTKDEIEKFMKFLQQE